MALVGVATLLVVVFMYFLCAGDDELDSDFKNEDDIGAPNIDDDSSSDSGEPP